MYANAFETGESAASHIADTKRAVAILQEEGCGEVYLFGSIATGTARTDSDLDLGIRDYPREHFFRIYGRLLMELEHNADLVDFDQEARLFEVLKEIGEVRSIA